MIKARLEIVKAIKGDLDNALDMLIDELKNKDLDLDERWAAYVDLVNDSVITKTELYGDGYIDTLGDFTLYDDFYVERHETETFINILERLQDKMADEDDDELTTPEKIIEWKEKVLASGYASFEHDW